MPPSSTASFYSLIASICFMEYHRKRDERTRISSKICSADWCMMGIIMKRKVPGRLEHMKVGFQAHSKIYKLHSVITSCGTGQYQVASENNRPGRMVRSTHRYLSSTALGATSARADAYPKYKSGGHVVQESFFERYSSYTDLEQFEDTDQHVNGLNAGPGKSAKDKGLSSFVKVESRMVADSFTSEAYECCKHSLSLELSNQGTYLLARFKWKPQAHHENAFSNSRTPFNSRLAPIHVQRPLAT